MTKEDQNSAAVVLQVITSQPLAVVVGVVVGLLIALTVLMFMSRSAKQPGGTTSPDLQIGMTVPDDNATATTGTAGSQARGGPWWWQRIVIPIGGSLIGGVLGIPVDHFVSSGTGTPSPAPPHSSTTSESPSSTESPLPAGPSPVSGLSPAIVYYRRPVVRITTTGLDFDQSPPSSGGPGAILVAGHTTSIQAAGSARMARYSGAFDASAARPCQQLVTDQPTQRIDDLRVGDELCVITQQDRVALLKVTAAQAGELDGSVIVWHHPHHE